MSFNPFLEHHKDMLYTSKAVARTGRDGYHFYFKQPAGSDIRCSTGKLAPNVDVRANGGYVIVPPSIHENGNPYTWEVELDDKI